MILIASLRESGEAKSEHPVHVAPVGHWDSTLRQAVAGDQLVPALQCHIHLDPRQVRSDAPMRSSPEGQVRCGLTAAEVHTIGPGHERVIAVAGNQREQHEVTGHQLVAVELNVLRSEEHTSELQSLMRNSYA